MVISALALHMIAWFSWLVQHSSPHRRARARITDVNHYVWLFYMAFRNQTQVTGVTWQVPLLAEPYHQPHLLFETQSLTSPELTEVRKAWLPRSPRNPPTPELRWRVCVTIPTFSYMLLGNTWLFWICKANVLPSCSTATPRADSWRELKFATLRSTRIFSRFFLAKQNIITFFLSLFHLC